jgi:hypothetical protein
MDRINGEGLATPSFLDDCAIMRPPSTTTTPVNITTNIVS